MRTFQFTKSSHSTKEHDCVEVARNIPTTVAVRDSKRPGGPLLTVAPAAWSAFTADLRRPQHP
ncbi:MULTISPECIES: DUF397 domain-containing protein [unclassified Streptomyces]|uniref:DUF397 domain-containing protein n=1 Tax=unclassified Streptomyces TaxID=2593676 RepID=UPI00081EF851|nr:MULTISPECIES: DUF397 domain-containing protein [unclassified Streptomyces]MYR93582.1 DUF397 domain-containing protein [Streptomyces sp. SID4937]SCD55580.1 protein of unknown function [Streptomyces sp. ScaeMP-e83]